MLLHRRQHAVEYQLRSPGLAGTCRVCDHAHHLATVLDAPVLEILLRSGAVGVLVDARGVRVVSRREGRQVLRVALGIHEPSTSWAWPIVTGTG